MYVPNKIKIRFSCEVDRIKQLLTNNNFPMAVIDEIICKFLRKKLNPDFERNNQDKANFIESLTFEPNVSELQAG